MAIVFLLILFVFLSAITTWYLFQNHVKENKLKSDDFMLELSSGRLADTLPIIAKEKGWAAFERIGEDSFRFKVPSSLFFWGGKVFLNLEAVSEGQTKLTIYRKPNFVTSQVQDGILDQEILDLLSRLGKVR
ncbi:MAG: hypothetical protein NBV57_05360 [Algoriphagus sp.]|nr:hypothetical protein [Algoriphagus sp.]